MKSVLGEAIRDLLSRRVLAISLLLVSSAVALSVCELAAAERDTLQDRAEGVLLDGWHVVALSTADGQGFTDAEVRFIAELEGVEWSVAYMASVDMELVSGELVPMRAAKTSDLDALVGKRQFWSGPSLYPYAIRMVSSPSERSVTVGVAGVEVIQVVGDSGGPHRALGLSIGDAVYLAPEPQPPNAVYLTVRLGTSTLGQARDLALRLPELLNRDFGRLTSIQPDRRAFEAQRALLSGLEAESLRRVSIFVLVGALVSGAIAGISTRQRASEFARRRALGCRRSTLFSILTTEAALCFGAGSILGVGTSTGRLEISGNDALPTSLLFAIMLVNFSLPALMTLPSFVRVALADPVSVLRVP